MTTEGYAETEEEMRTVIRGEGFRWLVEQYHLACRGGDPRRRAVLVEQARQRYGPELAAGLVEWEIEE